MDFIPQIEPWINENELFHLKRIIDTKYVVENQLTKEFEEIIKNYTKSKHVISMTNGTMCLFSCLKSLGLKQNDEVIVPNMTFIATSNAVIMAGCKPVFCEIDKNSLCIDPIKIKKLITSKTKAIMPVHLYGNSANIEEILEIAKRYNLKVIEDAAQGIGVFYKNKHVGTFADCGILSFYGNKTITSVTSDTPVIIKENGFVKISDIGNLMIDLETDRIIDVSDKNKMCLGFDKNGNIGWRKITGFLKHRHKGHILDLKLEKGKRVKITPSHSVFTINNGNIEEKKGSDLKEGDYIIAPRKLNIPEKKIILDLANLDSVNLKVYDDVVNIKQNKVGGGGSKSISRFLEIDKNFAKFLGYYVAEGCFSNDGLVFTFNINEKDSFAIEVSSLFKSIWPNFKTKIRLFPKYNVCKVYVGGQLHKSIINLLNIGHGAKNKKIPSPIWESSQSIKESFLLGLLNGDGHERFIQGCKSNSLGVSSKSLANEMHYLLLTLGIQSRVSIYESKDKKTIKYTCEILGDDQLLSKENCIPVEFLNLTEKSTHIQKGRLRDKKSISIKTIRKWLTENKIDVPSQLMEDICLIKIKKIENIEIDDFVYDFEVKGYENFIGGYGAVCLHNTGEGGVILTNDDEIAKNCYRLKNHGRDKKGTFIHEHIGFNFSFTEMQAAIGISQMEKLNPILNKKKEIHDKYNKELFGIGDIKFQKFNGDTTPAHWFTSFFTSRKKELSNYLLNKNIQSRDFFYPLNLQPCYKDLIDSRKFPISLDVYETGISLPSSYNLTYEQQDYIISNIKNFYE